MWNETVNEAMISVALQFLIGGGVIKCVCPVTLGNTNSVLLETILMDLLELSCAKKLFQCQKKPCRSAVGRSLIEHSNSLVFWVVCVCVHSSVEFL